MYINRSFVFVVRFLMILVQSVEKYSKINYTITFAIDFKNVTFQGHELLKRVYIFTPLDAKNKTLLNKHFFFLNNWP